MVEETVSNTRNSSTRIRAGRRTDIESVFASTINSSIKKTVHKIRNKQIYVVKIAVILASNHSVQPIMSEFSIKSRTRLLLREVYS